MSAPELLTPDEHRALELAGELWDLLSVAVVGRGLTRSPDLAELAGHVHAIQNAVLAQAAARAYPDRYRLMGRAVAAPRFTDCGDHVKWELNPKEVPGEREG